MHELVNILKTKPTPPFPNDAISKLLSGITKETLGDYLEWAIQDEVSIEKVARHSYKHQLGFEKFCLNPDRDNESLNLRLHYWSRNAVTPFEGEIHDHCHHFTSKVLIGILRHKFYELDRNSTNLSLFEYTLDSVTNLSRQKFICRTGVKAIGGRIISEGETYSLYSDTLHSVTVGEEYVLSLLVQGKRIKPTATVIKSKDKENKSFQGIGIGRLTTEQVIDRFTKLTKILRET